MQPAGQRAANALFVLIFIACRYQSPVPDSGTVCFPFSVSVLMTSVPDRDFFAEGLKVTEIVQLVPGFTSAGQLLV